MFRLKAVPDPNITKGFSLFPENEFDVDGDVVVIVGGRRFHVDKDVS